MCVIRENVDLWLFFRLAAPARARRRRYSKQLFTAAATAPCTQRCPLDVFRNFFQIWLIFHALMKSRVSMTVFDQQKKQEMKEK